VKEVVMPANTHDNPDDRCLPYLTIPYWEPNPLTGDPGDKGDIRPLPAGLSSQQCEGIQLLTPYTPGTALTVEIAVRNWGRGNNESIAIVSLWWQPEPTPSGPLQPTHFLGAGSVVVGPRGHTSKLKILTKVIPNTNSHIFLVARVHHPLDPAPVINGSQTPAPGVERHWAQKRIF
jgi:hypothetical protein